MGEISPSGSVFPFFLEDSSMEIKLENIISLCKSKNVELMAFHQDLLCPVVLCYRETEFQPYITWNCFQTTGTPQGICFEHGHYIQELDNALVDFYDRVEKQSKRGILLHYPASVLQQELKEREIVQWEDQYLPTKWQLGDIAVRIKDEYADQLVPSYEVCSEIAKNIIDSHNAELGINWDVIDCHIENYIKLSK
jgi:hypothetical protein